jgi:hypothetical protein
MAATLLAHYTAGTAAASGSYALSILGLLPSCAVVWVLHLTAMLPHLTAKGAVAATFTATRDAVAAARQR